MFDWPQAIQEIYEMERNGVPLSFFIEICEIADPDHPRQANRLVLKRDDDIGFATLVQYAYRYKLCVGIRNVNLLDHTVERGLPVSNRSDEIIVLFDRDGDAAMVLDTNDHSALGRILGIPECCISRFEDLTPSGVDENDVLWRQAAIDDAIERNVFTFHWAFNPVRAFIRFIPCTFDCPHALKAIENYIPPFHPLWTPVYESMEIQGHTFNFTLDTLN